MRKVLLAGKEAQEGAALQGPMLADGAAQHRVARLDGVKDGARGDSAGDLDLEVAADPRQIAQVKWKYDADFAHGMSTSAFALPPKERREGRARSAPRCRRHRWSRTPGLRWCRSRCRTYPANPLPSRRAARLRSNLSAEDPSRVAPTHYPRS